MIKPTEIPTTMQQMAMLEQPGTLVSNSTITNFNSLQQRNGSFLVNQPLSSHHYGLQTMVGTMEQVERPMEILDEFGKYNDRFPEAPKPKTQNLIAQKLQTPMGPATPQKVRGGYIQSLESGTPITYSDQLVASNRTPQGMVGKPGVHPPLNT